MSNPLSPREAEVLHWIIEGKSDSEIGDVLRLAPRTVSFHASNLRKKLGAKNRIQLALVAARTGLVPL